MIGIANRLEEEQLARNIARRLKVSAQVFCEENGLLEALEPLADGPLAHEVIQKYVVTIAIGMQKGGVSVPLEEHPSYLRLRGYVEKGLIFSGKKIPAQRAMNDIVRTVTSGQYLTVDELSGVGGAKILNSAAELAAARVSALKDKEAENE